MAPAHQAADESSTDPATSSSDAPEQALSTQLQQTPNNDEDINDPDDDDVDETRQIIDRQLDVLYVYQNSVTGSASSSPLSVRQLCRILSPHDVAPPSGGSGANAPKKSIHPDTLVIGLDPATQSYSSAGWMSCRTVPILREACARWHYQDGADGQVKGPVSTRILAGLLTDDATKVWSADIASAAQGSEGQGQWRSVRSDINLRIALEAFRTAPCAGSSQNAGETAQTNQRQQQPQRQAFDPAMMTYDEEAAGSSSPGSRGAAAVAVAASASVDAASTASTVGAGSVMLDQQRMHDELDAFLASTTAGPHPYDEEDDHEEEEEGFESDGGTAYVKDRRTGEWVRASSVTTTRPANNKVKPDGANNEDTSAAGGGGSNNHEQQKHQQTPTSKKRKKRKAKFAARNAAKWIYVTGLPKDTDEDEVASLFAKAGIIDLDPETQRPKVKLYRHKKSADEDKVKAGELKGDASICYARPESVELAVQILDESMFRPTSREPITVTRAKFEQKGDTFESSKRSRISNAKRKVARLAAVQAVDWDEGEHGRISGGMKGLRIIVLKGMFTLGMLAEVDDEDAVLHGIETELRTECEEKFGAVEKITVFSKNPAGVVVVKFAQAPAASAAVKELHGRHHHGERKIEATFWDGVTDYSVRDDEAEARDAVKRQEDFGRWLDTQDLPEEFHLKVEGE